MKQHEEWRPVPGAAAYDVSSLGRFRRRTAGHLTYAGREQKGYRRKDGYLWVMLREDDGRRACRALHRLVCTAFHGPPPFPGAQVAHGDGSRTHNAADNLSWKTALGNAEDRERHGRTRRGHAHYLSALSPEALADVRSSSLSCRAAAEKHGVSKATISRARRYVTY